MGMDDEGLDSGGNHTALLTTQVCTVDKDVELFGGRESGKVSADDGRHGVVKNVSLSMIKWTGK